MTTRTLPLLLASLLLAACGDAAVEGPGDDAAAADDTTDGELAGPFKLTDDDGKQDAVSGVSTSVAGYGTEVWAVSEAWDDRTTTAAKKAGLSWDANSGLTWEEKYARWVDTLPRATATDGYVTFSITSPYGRTLTTTPLECSEVALFLRSTFASWYGLPFFVSAVDQNGKRVYLGHFGFRTANGKYGGTSSYKTLYKDYGKTIPAAGWPSDAKLRAKALGDDAREAGLFFDDLYLNKRMGYFQLTLLNWFGSMNLADEANAFHVKPEAVRTGDVLVERWQKQGIGHVLLVKSVVPAGEQLEVTLASGSMPRRQPVWESEIDSKRYFTSEITGGEGTLDDGTPYAKLGGGLRRFKQAKKNNGIWANVIPAADTGVSIPASDLAAIAARPGRFETLLSEPSPAAKKESILNALAVKREHLRNHPASCSARIAREELFDELKVILRSEGFTNAEIDAQHRTIEDYVFAELSYASSKTCCWNSTDADMAAVVLDYARAEQADQCVEPTVFKSQTDGYARWAAHARTMGKTWKAWSEDEPCAQRDVAEDRVAGQDATAFCSMPAVEVCGDEFEPNDATAKVLTAGTYEAKICAGDVDRFQIEVPAGKTLRASVRFVHAEGDLDVKLFDGGSALVDTSDGTSNEETVDSTGSGRFVVQVYGYGEAANPYTLVLSLR